MKIYISKSRNIYNQEELKSYLKSLNDYSKENVRKWIDSNLKNWFIDKCSVLKEVKKAKKSDPSWVHTSIENGDLQAIDFKSRAFSQLDQDISHALSYLSTIDGRLNHSVEDAIRLANEYVNKIDLKKSEVGQTETLYTFKDGYTIKKLLDQKELNREGNLMGHCTKDERQGYFNKIKAKKIELWSLRDTSNGPHCTMEYLIDKKKVLQIKGKQNKGVVSKYIPHVKEFLQDLSKKKLILNFDTYDLRNIGILEQDGVWYDILCIPENFTVKGDLDLKNTQVYYLPKGLTVGGILYLGSAQIKELPEGLTVGGSLYLRNTQIECLPEGLTVNGDLGLINTPIKELPSGLTVGGSLYIDSTTIETLPKGFTVGGNLYIVGIRIKELPEGLTVGGDLDITGTKIRELPSELKVGRDLYIAKTLVTILPKNLDVGGNLDLKNSKVTELNEGLKVGGYLDLRDTKVQSIPEGLTVGGYFSMVGI
jgi:hypothetical protein